MNRRQMLRTIGAIGAAAAPAAMLGQQEPYDCGTVTHQTLITAASDCVLKGELCVAHCHQNLTEGDKSEGACVRSASEMLAVCGALRSLAAQNAPSLPRLAAVAIDVCRRCETECRKHERAQPCKDCADACAACAAECKKTAD